MTELASIDGAMREELERHGATLEEQIEALEAEMARHTAEIETFIETLRSDVLI